MLDMKVPHLHKVLLADVDVRELVYHSAGLGDEPGRVHQILGGWSQDGVRRHRQAGGGIVVQSEIKLLGKSKIRKLWQMSKVTSPISLCAHLSRPAYACLYHRRISRSAPSSH